MGLTVAFLSGRYESGVYKPKGQQLENFAPAACASGRRQESSVLIVKAFFAFGIGFGIFPTSRVAVSRVSGPQYCNCPSASGARCDLSELSVLHVFAWPRFKGANYSAEATKALKSAVEERGERVRGLSEDSVCWAAKRCHQYAFPSEKLIDPG